VQGYAPWASGGAVALLCAIFLLRGRIRIEPGWAGWTLRRFPRRERACHWVLALSSIGLLLTGLLTAHGQALVLALVGGDDASDIAAWARWLHARTAFAFMAALAMAFFFWVRHSLPSWRDIVWLAKGGGLLVAGVHPPAWKFNAAQKLLFWLVLASGLALSLSGLALLFPNAIEPNAIGPSAIGMIATAFTAANALLQHAGLPPLLPEAMGPHEAMAYALLCHGAAALGLVATVIVHVYLRTLIIEGALSAMASGEVDANWARQHHSLWAEREIAKSEDAAPGRDAPTG
jgi:formate dehydrogenase subunit gamma